MRPPDETGSKSGQPNPEERRDESLAAGPPAGRNTAGGADLPTEPMEPYLRLNEHIEALRADRRPPQPGPLRPEESDVYRMAALFRSAAPGADEPRVAFVADLRARLERERSGGRHAGELDTSPARQGLSRRSALLGGLGAAAAAVAGAAIGAEVTRQSLAPGSPVAPETKIVPAGQGQWVAVVEAASLPVGAVKWFATSSIVGFVRHTADGFSALSGVCTHMGCLLQWNSGDRTFDCPCHGGRFNEDGSGAPTSPVRYTRLPALQTKVEQNQVWVYVAAVGGQAPSASPPPNPYGAADDSQ